MKIKQSTSSLDEKSKLLVWLSIVLLIFPYHLLAAQLKPSSFCKCLFTSCQCHLQRMFSPCCTNETGSHHHQISKECRYFPSSHLHSSHSSTSSHCSSSKNPSSTSSKGCCCIPDLPTDPPSLGKYFSTSPQWIFQRLFSLLFLSSTISFPTIPPSFSSLFPLFSFLASVILQI